MMCQKRGARYGGVRGMGTRSPLFCQAQVFSSSLKTNGGGRKSQKVGERRETAQLMKMEGGGLKETIIKGRRMVDGDGRKAAAE